MVWNSNGFVRVRMGMRYSVGMMVREEIFDSILEDFDFFFYVLMVCEGFVWFVGDRIVGKGKRYSCFRG